MQNSERPDDANAVLLSSQNVLKRCKGTNKFGTNSFILSIIQPLLFPKDYLTLFAFYPCLVPNRY